MKKISLLFSLVAILILSACATTPKVTGGQPLPAPSAGFTPTSILPASQDKVYQATLAVLAAEGIGVVNEGKENGRISTDYANGPTQQAGNAFVGLMTMSTHYKYLINITKENKQTSKLMVKAFLESSSNSMPAWRDVSAENTTLVNDLQNSLIEKIEKQLGIKK